MTLADVPRNDIKAATRYYEARGKTISADEYRVLLRLQDDSKKFIEASKDWNVEAPPARRW